jgi:hypothetical protein
VLSWSPALAPLMVVTKGGGEWKTGWGVACNISVPPPMCVACRVLSQIAWDFGPTACVNTPTSPSALLPYFTTDSGAVGVGNNYGVIAAYLTNQSVSSGYIGASGGCNIGLALQVV